MTTKYTIGTVADFPVGHHKVIRVRDIEIGIFNVDGTLHALPNLCFHQWGPLCQGQVSGTLSATAATNWKYEWIREGQIVVCPWHSLEFDVTTGQCLAYPRVKLRRYPVEIDDNIVKVVL